jgi:hypothetical protein
VSWVFDHRDHSMVGVGFYFLFGMEMGQRKQEIETNKKRIAEFEQEIKDIEQQIEKEYNSNNLFVLQNLSSKK